MRFRVSARARLASIAAAVVTVPAAAAVTATALQAKAPPSLGAELAARFAPILLLAKDEDFRPIARSGYIGKAELRLVLRNKLPRLPRRPETELIDAHPSETSLPDRDLNGCPSGFNDCHYYLKLVGADPRRGPGAYKLVQAQLIHDGYGTTVYWNFDRRHSTLQYWFFYVFNDFVNRHEGDWEQITLVLGRSPRYLPREVGYSSHKKGEAKLWTQIPLGDGRSGDHLLVYVARGSHANYFDATPHRVFRQCPRRIRLCVEQNGGDGEKILPGSYQLANIDWRPYVGDHGPGNYVLHLGRWALATRTLTVRDPQSFGRTEWTDPCGWLSRARPADGLTAHQRQALEGFNATSCTDN